MLRGAPRGQRSRSRSTAPPPQGRLTAQGELRISAFGVQTTDRRGLGAVEEETKGVSYASRGEGIHTPGTRDDPRAGRVADLQPRRIVMDDGEHADDPDDIDGQPGWRRRRTTGRAEARHERHEHLPHPVR